MNQNLFSSILMPWITLLTFTFFLFTDGFVGAVDRNYEACRVPRNCGDNQTIRFPFYIKGLKEPNCGYPGFELSCNKNDQPILNLSNGVDYIIHKIFYHNQSIIVSNSAFSNHLEAGLCIPPLQNISLPNERFELPKQDQAFLLYDCQPPRVPEYEIGCSEANKTWVLGLYENDKDQLGNLSRRCGNVKVVVVAPVKNYGHESVGIREVLSRGFDLKWKADDCRRCEGTGGVCGFNTSTYLFQCYCTDRPHRVRCNHGDKELRRRLKFGLGLGFGLGVPVLFLITFMLWRYKQRHASSKFLARSITDPYLNTDVEEGSVYCGVPVFSYTDLQKATNNFDSEKELGDGGFGTVYHGKLKDGREVAVKRLYQHNYKRVEQFKNEVEILTRLRHKNLVSLYGCTSRHSRELLLVYEYISNGTVADHLHGDRSQPSLPWSIRMSIAIETATALTYLHASEIVHRDVKTNNILLDNNFCVKVADFGLSRLFPTDVTHISTCPQGTPGYVDPEYHQCYQLTSKSDVYSFGVVLIELISSMQAVDITRHRDEINLANLATNKIQKCEFHELIDQSLGFESDSEVKRMTITVAALAFQCLQQNKEMRPSMEEVLEALKSIEREVDRPENQDKEFDDLGVTESVQPPPSPECDELGLLKNTRSPLSPISVTQKWPSTRSVTPNDSGKMI